MTDKTPIALALPTNSRPLTFHPSHKPGEIIELAPDSLIIPDDKTDPLFDLRGLDPADESLALDIAENGFASVIWVVERELSRYIVVAGRRRVASAKAAEAQFVNCLILDPTLDDYSLVCRMIVENEKRKDDTVMNKARKAAVAVGLGVERFRPADKPAVTNGENGEVEFNGEGWRPSNAQRRVVIDDVARQFNVTSVRIKQLLSMTELAPALQKALESGSLPEALALKWKDKTPEQQVAALRKYQEQQRSKKGPRETKKKDYPDIRYKRPKLEDIRQHPKTNPAVAAFLNHHLGYTDLGGENGKAVDPQLRWLAKVLEDVEAVKEGGEDGK